MKRGPRDRFCYVLWWCLFLGSQTVWAATPDATDAELKAWFVPDSARVGSRVELVLTYRLPKAAYLPKDPLITGLEDLTIDDLHQGNGDIRAQVLVDQLGTLRTGALSLAYVDKEGKEKFLHTGPASLKVVSNLGERPAEAELKPIYGIMQTRSRLMDHLHWILIALAACTAAGLGLFVWFRWRRTQDVPSRGYVPPHTVAEKALQELESRRLFEKGRVKAFYFGFSEILRQYIESLRGFPAAEYTTQEIAQAVQAPEDRQILPLLQDADLVKFADAVPTSAQKEDDMAQALAYVRETGSASEPYGGGPRVNAKNPQIGRRLKTKPEVTAP